MYRDKKLEIGDKSKKGKLSCIHGCLQPTCLSSSSRWRKHTHDSALYAGWLWRHRKPATFRKARVETKGNPTTRQSPGCGLEPARESSTNREKALGLNSFKETSPPAVSSCFRKGYLPLSPLFLLFSLCFCSREVCTHRAVNKFPQRQSREYRDVIISCFAKLAKYFISDLKTDEIPGETRGQMTLVARIVWTVRNCRVWTKAKWLTDGWRLLGKAIFVRISLQLFAFCSSRCLRNPLSDKFVLFSFSCPLSLSRASTPTCALIHS